ncbi:MAG: hypothetical protein ACI9UR_001508 [Bacteroidia bacterium]|jgi:hypothetical protein
MAQLSQMNLPAHQIEELLSFADDKMEDYERRSQQAIEDTLRSCKTGSEIQNPTGGAIYEANGWVSFDD